MSGLSKVMVVVPEAGGQDARTARMLELGFAREGVPTTVVTAAVPDTDTGLVVVAGSGPGALDVVRRTRQVLDEQRHGAALVLAGSGIQRLEATRAGADEVVLLPTYLRDVVTIGRVLRAQPSRQRTSLVGSLAETTGVYALVRALGALGRSAVLTMIRGLRRGEIRFFHGEVTSAQVGLIHGQAAFHQLLLWTDARFEYHREDLVRRQQIPLSPDELFADAERFLEGVRAESGSLSPSLVLEQDVMTIRSLGTQIPTEVHGVLRMFDGHRVLADVLEDSPYRVFETLRVAQRAVDAGLLRVVETQRPRATWRAVLRIEEWLVGSAPPRDLTGPLSRETGPVSRETGPVPTTSAGGNARRKRKKKKSNAPAPTPAATPRKLDIDWGALVPRAVGAELAPLSGVVPAAHASGEIQLPPTREAPREKLESVMNTRQRDRFFPADLGLEPKVVFDDADLAAPAPVSAADAESAKLRDEASEYARQQAAARTRAEVQAREDEERARRLAATKAKFAADAPRVVGRDEITAEDAEDAAIWAAAKDKAAAAEAADAGSITAAISRISFDDDQTSAVARVSLDDDAPEPEAPIVSPIKPAARAPIPGIDDRPEARQGEIQPREPRATLEPRHSEPTILVGDLTTPPAMPALPALPGIPAAPPSTPAHTPPSNPIATATSDASPSPTPPTPARTKSITTPPVISIPSIAPPPASATSSTPAVATLDVSTPARTKPSTTPPPTTPADAAASSPSSAADATIADATTTSDESTETRSTPAASTATASTPAAPSTAASTPAASSTATASTPASSTPASSTPAASSAVDANPFAAQPVVSTSAATPGSSSTTPPPVENPFVAPAVHPEAPSTQSIVADLAAAHVAIAQVATTQAHAPASADLASSSSSLAVSEVRHGAQAAIADAAAAFTDAEEAFFRAGTERPRGQPDVTGPVETFDDLDEGYKPVGFWDRLRGKKPTKK